jgi:hypothetical protein
MQNQDTLALGQPSDSSAILPEITSDNRVDARSLHEAMGVGRRGQAWLIDILKPNAPGNSTLALAREERSRSGLSRAQRGDDIT